MVQSARPSRQQPRPAGSASMTGYPGSNPATPSAFWDATHAEKSSAGSAVPSPAPPQPNCRIRCGSRGRDSRRIWNTASNPSGQFQDDQDLQHSCDQAIETSPERKVKNPTFKRLTIGLPTQWAASSRGESSPPKTSHHYASIPVPRLRRLPLRFPGAGRTNHQLPSEAAPRHLPSPR